MPRIKVLLKSPSEVAQRLFEVMRAVTENHNIDLTVSTNFFTDEFKGAQKDEVAASAIKLIENVEQDSLNAIVSLRFGSNYKGFGIDYSPAGLAATLDVKSDQLPDAKKPQVPKLLGKYFNKTTDTEILLSSIPEELRALVNSHLNQIRSFEDNAAAIQQASQKQISDYSNFLLTERSKLEEEYNDKATELEKRNQAEAEKQKADIDAERKLIQEREKAIQKKEEEFETRDPTHVRRKIQDELMSDLKARKNYHWSDETAEKIKATRWAFYGALIVTFFLALAKVSLPLVGAAFEKAASNLGNKNADYSLEISKLETVALATSIGGVVLFGSILVWFLKWESRWSQEHARAEFNKIRFTDDMQRASWLAEFSFEWQRQKNDDVPEHLIRALSSNLFRDENWANVEHPADAVAKFVKNLAEVKLGPNEVEVKTNKAGKG